MESLGDVGYAIWIIALTFLIGRTIFFVIENYIFDSRKESDNLQRKIIGEIKWPFYLIVGAIGVYYATRSLELLKPFRGWMGSFFIIFVVGLGVYVTRKTLNAIFYWYLAKDTKRFKIENTALMSLRNLLSLFVYAIGAILILKYAMDVEVTPLIASLGIGGLAVALALQSTLANYFAGLYIASDRSARLGDYIQIDPDLTGYVEKMTWRSVWIKTIQQTMIIVPNSKLADATIINFDQPKQPMLMKIPCGVSYGSDLYKVEEVTKKVAAESGEKTGTTVEGEKPYVRFYEFGDSNINFNVWFKIKRWDMQYPLKHEFIKALKKAFDEEKIEISFPCTNVYMRGS
jgi:small-conductance mechanosensitive channel